MQPPAGSEAASPAQPHRPCSGFARRGAGSTGVPATDAARRRHAADGPGRRPDRPRRQPGAHRGRPWSGKRRRHSRAVVVTDGRSPAIDPRFVSLRIGPPRGRPWPPRPRRRQYRLAGRVRPPPRRAPLSRPGGFSGTRPTGGGPLSAHTTHRGAGPRPGGPAPPGQGPRHEPEAGQPSSPASSSPGSGTIRLSTPETRRLHVVRGNAPDDPEGRSLLGPFVRTASPRWRGRR